MGVTGLWKLIEPCGTPVPIETLEGKILAVDISIWLHQVVKGFQDSNGSALAHAHLLGLFHRLCKLLYYRVKPVFVFDGCVPQLKRDTIARRQQQRNKLNTEANRIQNLLLEQLAKEQVVQKALGSAAKELIPAKRAITKPSAQNNEDEMFKLPELPTTSHNSSFQSSQTEDGSFLETSYASSDDEESEAQRYYQANLQAIDVKSSHFRSLPADMRYDILVDIKETRKQSSWGRLHELPAQREDFSAFQMKRLLKRRAVQESLEMAEKEMGGRTLTYGELHSYFKEEGVLPQTTFEEASRPIACDENSRYLLMRDLQKYLQDHRNKQFERKPAEDGISQELPKKEEVKEEEEVNIKEGELGADYEHDLQKAIALSLSEQDDVYRKEDYILENPTKLKLNNMQIENLQHAAKGPAKSYMIEYAGINEEEITEIMEKSQVGNNSNKQTRTLSDSETETCSEQEFIEVQDNSPKKQESPDTAALEVVIDLDKGIEIEEDDLFADVFKEPITKIVNESLDSDSDEDLIEVMEEVESSQKLKPITTENSSEQKAIEEQSCTEKVQNEEKLITNRKVIDGTDEDFVDTGLDAIEIIGSKTRNTTPLDLLAELARQLKESNNINLNDIEIKNDIVEIPVTVEQNGPIKHQVKESLDEKITIIDQPKTDSGVEQINTNMQIINEAIEILDKKETEGLPTKSEIIEILDETEHNICTPPVTPKKSAKICTPSRITDFYEKDYIIKRTPDKDLIKAEPEDVPKVKSPFYRNKTPKSKSNTPKSSKSQSPTETKSPTNSKAAKQLFTENPQPTVSAEDILEEAASNLKQQKSDAELRSLATGLAQERKELESERNRQDRMGMSISQRMNAECQELLRLFGIPYIVAPMEAEAQCAFLDAVQLTNGTITDDSDIWLFGGRTVYKNFFVQNKHVLKFSAEEIETQFKCDRQTLVQLACLVGSDYTTGVHGIGAVTALEILSSFSRVEQKNVDINIKQRINCILDNLQRFRDWWQASKVSAVVPGSSARNKLLKKLRNIEMQEGFPSVAVVEAYLLPKVDESRTRFSWGKPDVECIREFTRKTFGWTTLKTDEILTPVLKRLEEKCTQASLRNYFLTHNAVNLRKLKVSKRVQGAIQRFAEGSEIEPTTTSVAVSDEVPAKKVRKETKAKKSKKTKAVEASTEESETETAKPEKKVPRKRRNSNLPGLKVQKDIIPQRQKDMAEMQKNKEKATEIFKKMKNDKKYKK